VKYELLQFGGPEELAREAGRRFADAVRRAPRNKPFLVALSGGRIAKNLCQAIADEAKRDPALPCSAHFFWGDERCVPPDDGESNFKLADDNLFQVIRFPANQIHRIRGEVEPSIAAKDAEQELRRFAEASADGQPMFDLVFLGMGEDGHTASLFPEEGDRMVNDPIVFRPVKATKPPPQRITAGYQTLAAARNVWVLASGKGKEQALQNSLSSGNRTPLGRVIGMRGATVVFSDIDRPG
jgi:6-phosphogluconolactonase